MRTLIAILVLGIPTLMLAAHAVRVAAQPRLGARGGSSVPFIDLNSVGLCFAACLVGAAAGRVLSGHDALKGVSIASLFTFCAVIAWGVWAQGTRSHASPAPILLG